MRKCKQVVVDLSGFSPSTTVCLFTLLFASPNNSHALIFEPSAIFQDMIVKAGGMKAIISAMVLMPKEAELQMSGCGALWNLCFKNGILKKSFSVLNLF